MTVLVAYLVSAAVAAADWYAVARTRHRLELVAKPLVMVGLIVAASAAHLRGDVSRPWLIAALVLGLLGDVGLAVSDDEATEPDLAFMAGLGSFLLGHVCFVVTFVGAGQRAGGVAAGLAIVAVVAVLVLRRVVQGAARSGGVQLAAAVSIYAAALSTMVVCGVGTGLAFTAVGAVVFMASDATLAFDRFVRPVPRAPVIVIVTYHLAQAMIIGGLLA